MDALEGLDDEDFHDKLANLLGESSNQHQDTQDGDSDLSEYLSTNMIADHNKVLNASVDQVSARRISGQIYQTMHKVLFDQVDSLVVTRKSGNKLLNRKLVGISAGNLSVFTRRVDQQDISAAITVLVDGSPSMMSRVDNQLSLMDYANTCALSFSLGLTKSGIANETIYYGDYENGRYLAYTAKSFGSKPISKNFGFRPNNGTTPTGEAMIYALNSLALRPENKKMLIVLTDGHPCCSKQVRKAREIAQAFNVKVVPIGICTDVVGGFENGDFVTVNEPAELASALRNAVKMKLFS
jgi:cobalamin biosynthesis protein CobT